MTWGDVIEKAEAERFVGREQELFSFRINMERNPPRYLIYFIVSIHWSSDMPQMRLCDDRRQNTERP
jgi:hypothetical protein